jgi:AmiR/NasT family two-component response regulator
MAGFAWAIARTHENERRRAENLHVALVARELIGQAQGILIERERITVDQAFHIQASQHLNVKVREVARDLVDTGERPDTGSSHASWYQLGLSQ